MIYIFRRTLVQSFLYKFYVHVGYQLRRSSIDTNQISIIHPYRRAVSHG